MAFCYFIQATRGGGKGAYSCTLITDFLSRNCRVATNMDLWLDNYFDDDFYCNAVRLPDKPRASDMYALGQAYDFDQKNPSTVDPSKEGLILLDEISLFLSLKSDKEFQKLMAFFMLSRKLGWNLVFILQNKDQAEGTFYKSLCDKLIICQNKGLQTIPLFGKSLQRFGFSGKFSDSHEALIFSGRSELHDLDQAPVRFHWKPYRNFYNTNQLFEDGFELVGDSIIDMRASFTYLPPSYLTGKVHLNRLQEKTSQILKSYNPDNEEEKMAHRSTNSSLVGKAKIVIIVAFIAVYFVFVNNPLDNKLLAGEGAQPDSFQYAQDQSLIPLSKDSSDSSESIPAQNIALRNVNNLPEYQDYIHELFTLYNPRLSSYMSSDTFGVLATIDFYDGDTIIDRITSKDLKHYGYYIKPFGDSILVKSNYFKTIVRPWLNAPEDDENRPSSIPNYLHY